jgi:hypothetical protein
MGRQRRTRSDRYRQRFSRSQKLFHFVSLRLQAVMRTQRVKSGRCSHAAVLDGLPDGYCTNEPMV